MAAALNPQLTTMLAALDVVQPGLGNEFVAHVGTTMALAAAMPPDWFPKTERQRLDTEFVSLSRG
jgi:hypothetical protein